MELMLIAGIQQTTLVDYPNKVACIVFTPGCNLRCRFCHNPELVLPSLIKNTELIPQETFFRFLQTRVGLLDAVVISGGEPTLQSDLADFCTRVHEMGFAVKLDTNGRDPVLVNNLIQGGLVDYVAMDIKANHAQRLSLLQTKERPHPYLATIQLLLNSTMEYEFRTTMIKPYHDHDSFQSMLQLIHGARHYYLQTYRSDITLESDFDGCSYTYHEMLQFQKMAHHYVQHCDIR